MIEDLKPGLFKWSTLVLVLMISGLINAEQDEIKTINTNPTNRIITPRKNQTEQEQYVDQQECYDWSCELLDWDPYQAYDELVEQGYTVALDPGEWERGLMCLAVQGAVAGTVAGELVDQPESGAVMGAAMGAVSGLIQFDYLLQPNDPQAQKIISRFERDLRKWETKFAGCLSRKGYRVPSE